MYSNQFIKSMVILLSFLVFSIDTYSQAFGLKSPNNKIQVDLLNEQANGDIFWYLKVSYIHDGSVSEAIPRIDLGLKRSDADFSKNLKLVNAGKIRLINEEYDALYGKRSHRTNQANEVVVSFQNGVKSKMNVTIRAYNDGVAFSYEFPESSGTYVIEDELTAYTIADSTTRWLQKFNPANEGYYREAVTGDDQKDWAYPALFQTKDHSTWFLLHEADLGRTYCGTKLTNFNNKNQYKLTFPDDWNGRGKGKRNPTVSLPWKSPWRIILLGNLSDILESTLVDDASASSKLKNTDWIKPGLVSWNYWSDNHGTKDYQVVKDFADLAVEMGWPYTLLDWEWDAMGNGGNLNDALAYIHSKGVKPLMWYNSGGDHTWVGATPKDRMLTHENRVEEFKKLQKLGVKGVKVDFFESEKQDMINYYLNILEDAADYQIMVYFHGCLVPRGWQRTYPHLMTYEGVRGAEWYNNVPDFTYEAPVHNTILPFTRNVVGSMDYTPVTFTNSQHPHITSFGHELALSVLFESALQHLADRPEGYRELTFEVRSFLRDIPTTWDDTRLVSGFPGKDVTMARRKVNTWYVAGINGEDKDKKQTISLDFLTSGTKYKLTLIGDGAHDKIFSTEYFVVDRSDSVDIKMLRRGGFVASLIPIMD
jgi:alpha-glucosidase